ncbi:ASCH domain-containing protein [Patescibacteria group bacterium]
MQVPLYALLLAPDDNERRAVESGQKTITIRKGHRDYRVGYAVMICCHIEPWCVMADISSVVHCTLEEVTEEELRDDGFTDHADMIAQLGRFYPDISLTSQVTVIRWVDVRGKLVDAQQTKD